MITGFNTDVEHDGRVFHVQTEDKGRGNPVVETLVYSGGEIMDSITSSYEDLVLSQRYSEEDVQKRMEKQHHGLVREIGNGKYDRDGQKPFGYNIITNRSLDAVVLDYLTNELGVEQIRLEMEGHRDLIEGGRPTLRLTVLEESTERPIAGSRVVIKLLSTTEKPRELFSGVSDDAGKLKATIRIPRMSGAETAILCQAEAAGSNSEIKQLVLKGKPAAKKRQASSGK